MMRTFTNVTGDAAVATAVAKWEGDIDLDVYMADDNLSAQIDDRDPAAVE